MNKPLLSPSILSADFGNLQKEIEMLNESLCDMIHVDIMDGGFVPNISFGFPILKVLKKHTQKPLDVHLMIQNPENWINQFVQGGADIITIHFENSPHIHRTISLIQSLGAKAGLAINPHTPISSLDEILPFIDLVLVMSVNPGFGGQSFIETSHEKVHKLNTERKNRNLDFIIQVDGGVNLENGKKLILNGADSLVVGNSIFGTENPINTIHQFKTMMDETHKTINPLI